MSRIPRDEMDEMVGGRRPMRPRHPAYDSDKHWSSGRREYSRLHRFMKSRVGQLWDNVFSEMCEKFTHPVTTPRDYVKWSVDLHTYKGVDGVIRTPESLRSTREFYVHPDGTLRWNDPTQWRKQWKRDSQDRSVYYQLVRMKLIPDDPRGVKSPTPGFADNWFIETPMAKIRWNEMYPTGKRGRVWECRNGAWLIHEVTHHNQSELVEYRAWNAETARYEMREVTRARAGQPEWTHFTRSASKKEIEAMKNLRAESLTRAA